MNKNFLITLLADEQLIKLASAYMPKSDESGLTDQLKIFKKQLSADRFVLPIAGIQGCGKSTLLNALAFDQPVLPIDADETTCVPVEIAWAAQPKSQAIVHYVDGRIETLPCTEEALRTVVHNEANPGNKKQVDCVVLESNREMFKQGLVLVDLPGTGSLTAANMATTQRYLAEAVGVIFMLRTVPPLTRSEAIFVSMQWASLRTALFVQNKWNDETNEEADAGRDHNAKVLQDIAKKAGLKLSAPPTIHVVNGYEALRAALNQDANLADFSGLNALGLTLTQLGKDWAGQVSENIINALIAVFDQLRRIIDDRLLKITLDSTQHKMLMTQEEQRFAEYIARIDEYTKQMREDAKAFRQEIRQKLETWSNDKGGELRNRMRTKMRKGIVDGPRLARALEDEQDEATDDIFSQVQEDALALQDRLSIDLEGFKTWNAVPPDARFSVNIEEVTKYENVLKPVLGAAGTVGGILAAEAGLLAPAVVLLGSNPAGWAVLGVGVLVGAVGGLLGSLSGGWLGSKSKEMIHENRVKAAEPEVFAAIDKYVRNTSETLNNIAEEFYDQLDERLIKSRNTQTTQFEQERQRSMGVMNLTQQDKNNAAIVLKTDLATLDTLRVKLHEVCA